MKKTFKRLGAMFLAMVMAVSVLCTGAFAADPETFTISVKSEDTHTYSVYQIFTGTLNSDKTKLSDVKWGQNGTGKQGDLVDSTTLEELSAVDNNATDKVKLETILKYANLNGTAYATDVTAKSSKTDVPAGYYLIKDKDTITGNDTATTYIVKVANNVEIERKASVPSVDKKVKNESADSKDYASAAEAKIGDTVDFQLTGHLPSNFADYTKPYYYKFTDTLSKGLTYTTNSLEVYVVHKDNTETKVDPSSYTFTPGTYNETNGTTITVEFPNLNNVATKSEGEDSATVKNPVKMADTPNSQITIVGTDTIVVRYKATLNKSAVIGKDGNKNSVKLDYSNDPNTDGKGETGETVVNVYTFTLQVFKKNAESQGLKGAQFKLYDSTGTNEIKVVKVSDGTYRVATQEEINATEDSQIADCIETPDGGTISIQGLKAGTYYLEEIKAPDGYNTLTNKVKVVITSKAGETDGTWILDNVKSNTTADYPEDQDKTGSIESKTDKDIAKIEILNTSGSNLPSTGGMGTKLFYTVGGLLMAGAAIVLVIKKRRSSAE